MRSLFTLGRLVAQVLVALFAFDSIVTHFKPQYTGYSNRNRIQPELNIQHYGASQWASSSRGMHSSHQYLHNKQQSQPAYTVTTWTSADRQIQHYTLERSFSDSNEVPSESVLFLTVTQDNNSWGRNPNEPPRTIYSFLDFITNTTLAPSTASVAILTSLQSEFDLYKQVLTPSQGSPALAESETQPIYYNYPFHRVTLVLHTAETRAIKPLSSDPHRAASSQDQSQPTADQASTSRNNRHSIPQHERRSHIAKLRNYLQSTSLSYESHLVWLDSDVYKFSSNTMVSNMLRLTRTTDDHEVGVLTARCRRGEPEITDAWLRTHSDFRLPPPPAEGSNEPENEMRGVEGGKYEVIAHKLRASGNYDLNAWRGRRTGPNNIELEDLHTDLTSWEPHPAPHGGTHMLDQVIGDTANMSGVEREGEVVRLDSVGGTVLMVRADLVRMGLGFATGYLVGMTFEFGEGFDGIETEGICLLSRTMSRDGGSMCYTMKDPWSVWHTVY